jgi:formylglycine-generating enzyme required for sulfatase activity
MSTRAALIWSTLMVVLAQGIAAAPAWGKGDSNGDGNIDLADYDAFAVCLSGPDGGLLPDCAVFDFDSDLDVDDFDFAMFLRTFGFSIAPPEMVFVAAGEFQMGDPFFEGDPDAWAVHAVYLDAYYIYTHEVTNQLMADTLNWALAQGGLIEVTGDGVVKQPGTDIEYCDTEESFSYSLLAWDGVRFAPKPNKDHQPLLSISWHGAVAFCNLRSMMEGRTPCYDLSTWACDFDADGYRLPTEAEWEKAAAWDPVEQRHYRFSEHSDGCGEDCLDGHRANFFESGDPYEAGSFPWLTPVGFYNGEHHHKWDFDWPGNLVDYPTQDAQSYYGCRDMTGSLLEWCNDWYYDRYYLNSPYENPQGPPSGEYRVARSGSWLNTPLYCRSANRIYLTPENRTITYGFRCVTRVQ